ncbi:hypothetical protein EYF80_063643 [Liparis tanakae]|uniref:Uncharacterized protein n=1 Tax=Liparis tanakae TaxID=230148 RepID=A0A4Z2ECC3_9TELE|nr:hypothetical protein EYF80_063643 [Liparis tanakae]
MADVCQNSVSQNPTLGTGRPVSSFCFPSTPPARSAPRPQLGLRVTGVTVTGGDWRCSGKMDQTPCVHHPDIDQTPCVHHPDIDQTPCVHHPDIDQTPCVHHPDID